MGVRDPKKTWFLTYPQTDLTMAVLLERLSDKEEEISEYLIAEETHKDGAKHLHAYVKFKHSGIRLSDAPSYFTVSDKSGNYQPCRSCKDVIRYCSKEGNYICSFDLNSYMNGKAKLSVETIKSKSARQALVDGDISIHAIKNYNLARSILCEPYEHDDVRGVWIWGDSGVGKSRYARDTYPNPYLKSQNKWFDGYEGQEVILLDDFDQPGKCLGHYLKIWTDRYACTGEVKGAQVNLQHKVFVITSNYRISDIFDDDPVLLSALERRFKVIEMTASQIKGPMLPVLDPVPELRGFKAYAPGFSPGG